MTLTSVITCTYNRPDMLQQAMASVRTQTRGDWEHLVVDAGSEDPAVWALIQEAARADPRVRAFRASSPNVNQPARYWNMLLDRVRGDFITFLDDDNEKSPRFLEVMAGALEGDSTLDAVTCGFVATEEGRPPEENHLNLRTAELLDRHNTVDTGAFLIRREAMERVGYFPLDIRTNEDWAMVRRMHQCLRVRHLPDLLAVWRRHPGQRMNVAEGLGNARDKETVRWAPHWYAGIGVEVVKPLSVGSSVPAQQCEQADNIEAGIRAVPWIEEGVDLCVVLFPSTMTTSSISALVKRRQNIVFVCDADFAYEDMYRVREVAAYDDHVWITSLRKENADYYREVVGERVVLIGDDFIDSAADVLDTSWRTRAARIVNAVRSKRFGAVIP